MGSSGGASARARLLRRLGIAPWIVAALGVCSSLVFPGGPDGPPIRTAFVVTLGLFFALLITRLLIAATSYPSRRLSLLFLAAGVALWAAGSATVSASQTVTTVTFPAPGEILYLLSYLGLAAFLLLDVPRGPVPKAGVWFEAAVICGAATCLAAVAVLTPLSRHTARDGIPLLLAILYPVIDLLLAAIVFGQFLLRQRQASRRTAALGVAFFGLGVADSSFLVNLANHSYSSNIVLAVVWGSSFGILVAAAVSRPRAVVGPHPEPHNSRLMLASTAVALTLLVLHPGGTIGWFVVIPAVVTLVCAGGRLALALRESEGAAEALRLSLTDELTGLPNRRALLAATGQRLASSEPVGVPAPRPRRVQGHQRQPRPRGGRPRAHAPGGATADRRAARGHDRQAGRRRVRAPGADRGRAEAVHDRPRRARAAEGTADRGGLDAPPTRPSASPSGCRRTHRRRAAPACRHRDVRGEATRSGALCSTRAGRLPASGCAAEDLRGRSTRTAVRSGTSRRWTRAPAGGGAGGADPVAAPDRGAAGPWRSSGRAAGRLMPALTEAVMRPAVATRALARAGAPTSGRDELRAFPGCSAAGCCRGCSTARPGRLPPGRSSIEVTEDSFLADPEHAGRPHELRAHDVRQPSTTTAPASPRWPTCATSRSRSSRSTARSSRRSETRAAA